MEERSLMEREVEKGKNSRILSMRKDLFRNFI